MSDDMAGYYGEDETQFAAEVRMNDFSKQRIRKLSTPDTRKARAAALEHTATRVALARIDRARRKLEAEEEWILSRPAEPDVTQYDDGPVVYFRKKFGNPNIPADAGYQYVAVYVAGMKRWYLTGPKSPRVGMAWLDLVDWAAKDELEVPTIWLADGWRAVNEQGLQD